MKTLLLSAAAVGSLALVVPALAQTAPDSQVMIEMHHGPMTRAEIVEMVQSHFAKLDANHDGFLTKTEMDSAHDPIRSEVRTRIEKHTREHAGDIPDRGAMFDRLDANHDGSISRQEFTSAKPMIEKRVVVMNDGKGLAEHGKMGLRMHAMGMRFGSHMFEKADLNNDGRVSIQEATTAAATHFDSADANHDGTLSPAEMRAAHQVMRANSKS